MRRGWSKHCPHCGTGELFIGWNKSHRHCPVCGYLYERDCGDVWWVWIVTDRIPVGIGICGFASLIQAAPFRLAPTCYARCLLHVQPAQGQSAMPQLRIA